MVFFLQQGYIAQTFPVPLVGHQVLRCLRLQGTLLIQILTLATILLNFISCYNYFYFETGFLYGFLPGFEFAHHLLSSSHHSQMVFLKLWTWEGGANVFHLALDYAVREEKGIRYKG